MKKTMRILMTSVLVTLCVTAAFAHTGDSPIKAQAPILITTTGQGPGGEFADAMIKRGKIAPSRLAAKADIGFLTGQHTLIVVLSSSLKGMGSAGVSIGQELNRINSLVDHAKRLGMTIIGCHIEGEARRGGYDEDFINQIAPKMNYLIVRNDGNADGIFNRIARKDKIPITFIDKTSELAQVFTEVFN
jgi:hypothetical protein